MTDPTPSPESMEKAHVYLREWVQIDDPQRQKMRRHLALLLDSERAQAREAAEDEEREKHAVAMRMRAQLEKERDLLRERLNQFEAYAMPNVAAALDRIALAEKERDEARAERDELQREALLQLRNGPLKKRLEAAEARLREVEDAGIAENHAIMALTGTPREGYTLQQEIRAQLEETRGEVRDLIDEKDGEVRELRAALERIAATTPGPGLSAPSIAEAALARTETPK